MAKYWFFFSFLFNLHLWYATSLHFGKTIELLEINYIYNQLKSYVGVFWSQFLSKPIHFFLFVQQCIYTCITSNLQRTKIILYIFFVEKKISLFLFFVFFFLYIPFDRKRNFHALWLCSNCNCFIFDYSNNNK